MYEAVFDCLLFISLLSLCCLTPAIRILTASLLPLPQHPHRPRHSPRPHIPTRTMRVISVLALSFLAAAQAFMPTAAPVTRSRGALSMVKVSVWLWCWCWWYCSVMMG